MVNENLVKTDCYYINTITIFAKSDDHHLKNFTKELFNKFVIHY